MTRAAAMQLVLASNNQRKLRELHALFAPIGVELLSQASLGVSEAEEPHLTFIENALAKARHAAQHTRRAAMSDDSGVCIAALGGAPGVISADFDASALLGVDAGLDREARRNLQDAANNRLLIERMQGVADRSARYVCTLVAVRSAEDPEPLVAVGRWEGRIEVPEGQHGFGYDPLMFIPEFGLTVAQLSAEVKNEHSHRARAARQMRDLMREAWRL